MDIPINARNASSSCSGVAPPRRVLDAISDAFLSTDATGRILEWNLAAELLFGYPRDAAIGNLAQSLLLPSGDRGNSDAWISLSGSPAAQDQRILELMHAGRRKITVSVTFWTEGRDEAAVRMAVIRDLTPAGRMEHHHIEAERLAAINQMVAGVAHESRNALQQIQACAQMLSWELVGQPRALELVNDVQAAQDRLHRLFEDLRAYAESMRLDKRAVSLRSIWREAWEAVRRDFPDRDIQLNEASDTGDFRCEVDPLHCGRIFQNIMENSVAACDDPVMFKISAREASWEGRPAWAVSCCDNGPGLSQSQREKIFFPFYTTKTHGTGLGMPIAKRLVEEHGGMIAVGDDCQPGTEIRITLPRGDV